MGSGISHLDFEPVEGCLSLLSPARWMPILFSGCKDTPFFSYSSHLLSKNVCFSCCNSIIMNGIGLVAIGITRFYTAVVSRSRHPLTLSPVEWQFDSVCTIVRPAMCLVPRDVAIYTKEIIALYLFVLFEYSNHTSPLRPRPPL